MKTYLLFAIFLTGLLVSCSGKSLPILAQVPEFSFLDQRGRPVGLEDLKGHVWVADFIYTGCADVCPMLTQKMGELQKEVRLVSFTVDPENDTPEKLALYAERFGADPERWLFLTGPLAEIEKTIEKGFKIGMEKKSAFEIVHGDRFVLVDRQGRIRGYYEEDSKGMKALRAGIGELENR